FISNLIVIGIFRFYFSLFLFLLRFMGGIFDFILALSLLLFSFHICLLYGSVCVCVYARVFLSSSPLQFLFCLWFPSSLALVFRFGWVGCFLFIVFFYSFFLFFFFFPHLFCLRYLLLFDFPLYGCFYRFIILCFFSQSGFRFFFSSQLWPGY